MKAVKVLETATKSKNMKPLWNVISIFMCVHIF